MTIYLPDALAAEVKAGLTDTNISAVCQAALRVELEREKAMEKIDADGYQRVVLYDGKREHDIAFQGRKVGSSQKADAWLTAKGTIAVYDHREQELDRRRYVLEESQRRESHPARRSREAEQRDGCHHAGER